MTPATKKKSTGTPTVFLRHAFTCTLIVALVSAVIVVRGSIAYLHFRGSDMTKAPMEWSEDDVDYDNIALTLIHRGVFGFDWDDPEWVNRYMTHSDPGYFDKMMKERDGFGPTEFKPPAFPFVLSVVYRMFGTDFIVGRITSLAFMTLAVVAIILFAHWLGGFPLALAAAIAVIIRPHPTGFGATLMTESMATFMTTIAFVSFFAWMRLTWSKPRVSPRTAVGLSLLTGLLLGLVALTRSVYFLWLPFILLASFTACWRSAKGSDRATLIRNWTLFFITIVVTLLPWSIRNSVLAGHFSPMGTQGGISLAGAYSDDSFNSRGEWVFRPFMNAYNEYEKLAEGTQMPSAEHEYMRNAYGQHVAMTWAREHWTKLPLLMLMRVYSHHMVQFPVYYSGNFGVLEPLLLLLLVAGLIGWWKQPWGKIFTAVFLIDAAVIALTYSSFSRFLTPFIPIYGLATAGIIFLDDHSFDGVKDLYRFLTKNRSYFGLSPLRFFTILFACMLVVIQLTKGSFHIMNLRNPVGLSFPAEGGSDDSDYENLAFGLAMYNKFQFDWDSPLWRSRYAQHNEDGRFNDILGRKGVGYTSFRAPLFPAMVSVVYRIFGLGFTMPRLVNLFLALFSSCLAVIFSGCVVGTIGAIITAGIIVLLPGQTFGALAFLTEPLTTFLFTVGFISFYFFVTAKKYGFSRRRTIALSFVSGLSAGLIVLSHSIYVIWIPFAALFAFVHVLMSPRAERRLRLQSWAVIVVCFFAVAMPWWIRNSLVVHHFSPFGVEGTHGMTTGYSDEAYESGGDYNHYVWLRSYGKFNATFQGPTRDAEYEYLRGQYIQSVAMDWIKTHVDLLPDLFLRKLEKTYAHYYNRSEFVSLVFVALLVFGAIGWLTVPGGYLFLMVLGIDMVAIGLTWASGGRFLFPREPVMGIMIAGLTFIPSLFRNE